MMMMMLMMMMLMVTMMMMMTMVTTVMMKMAGLPPCSDLPVRIPATKSTLPDQIENQTTFQMTTKKKHTVQICHNQDKFGFWDRS